MIVPRKKQRIQHALLTSIEISFISFGSVQTQKVNYNHTSVDLLFFFLTNDNLHSRLEKKKTTERKSEGSVETEKSDNFRFNRPE